MKFEIYSGVLDRKKMSKEARYGYESYNGQKAKCNNPKNRMFKYYGGKGLKVEYSAREFIGWWLHNLKEFKGKTATVGRIDHDKGYFFSNIEMQDVGDNSREALMRNKLHTINNPMVAKKVNVLCKKTGEHIATINGIRPTAEFFEVSQRLVHFVISGRIENSKKINFKLELA